MAKKLFQALIIILFLIINGCTAIVNDKEAQGNKAEHSVEKTIDIKTIRLKEVDSSAISHLGYKDGVLIVVFVKNYNRCYVYKGVPDNVYYKLLNADSIGSYYNSEIKGQYTCERIDGVVVKQGFIELNNSDQ